MNESAGYLGGSADSNPKGVKLGVLGGGLGVATLLCLCVMALLPDRSLAGYQWVREWPVPNRASGIAVSGDGIFITQRAGASTEPSVQRYTPAGKLLRQWGDVGTGPGQLTGPDHVTVDPDGRVRVVDGFGEILLYTPNGQLVDSRIVNSPCGRELLVNDVETDSRGDVYMPFYDNCNLASGETREGVIRSNTSWQVLNAWGDSGPNDGEFNSPGAVASDGNGKVYVADSTNYRIQQFTPEGQFVRKWGQLGFRPGTFNGLADVAIGPNGHVFAADRINQRIQRFTAAGKFVEEFEIPEGVEYRGLPHSIDFDAKGNLYLLGTEGAEIVDEVHVFSDPSLSRRAGVSIPAQKLRHRGGKVKVRLSCKRGGACAGKLRIRAGRLNLAQGGYRIGSGKRGTATARTSARGRALIRKRGRVKVTVELRPKGGGKVTRKLTLRG